MIIIGWVWANYCDLSLASRSITCQSWGLRQIIDLQVKSWYFVITELDNVVLSFHCLVCFHILITSWQLREASYHFLPKSMVPITHEQNIISSKTCLDGTTHEQTIISSQLFASHVVDSPPIERKKKIHRMIRLFIAITSVVSLRESTLSSPFFFSKVLRLKDHFLYPHSDFKPSS